MCAVVVRLCLMVGLLLALVAYSYFIMKGWLRWDACTCLYISLAYGAADGELR